MSAIVDFGGYDPQQQPSQPQQQQQQQPTANLAFYQPAPVGGDMVPPANPHFNPYAAPMIPGSLGAMSNGGYTPGSLGSLGGSGSGGGSGGIGSHSLGPSSGSFEVEPPLLEELGVNFFNIQERTMSVLHPLRPPRPEVMAEADLAGPLLFCLMFAASLLASGKIHFGYIYGVATLGCISLYAVLNLMLADGRTADLSLVASTMGYCLLPMVGLSSVGIILSLQGLFGGVLTALCVVWCTHAASAMFTAGLDMHSQRLLVAYPCFLFYGVFALLTIF